MAMLAAAAPFISAGGTALSVLGTLQQGRYAQASANFEAKQMEARAKAERATSQREAIERKRQIDLAGGRARAASASGGVALASPMITNILGGLAYEGDYAFQSVIASGEEEAKGYETGAGARRIEGKNARMSSYGQAAGTLASFAGASSAKSLFERYGGGAVTLSGGSGNETLRGF